MCVCVCVCEGVRDRGVCARERERERNFFCALNTGMIWREAVNEMSLQSNILVVDNNKVLI